MHISRIYFLHPQNNGSEGSVKEKGPGSFSLKFHDAPTAAAFIYCGEAELLPKLLRCRR